MAQYLLVFLVAWQRVIYLTTIGIFAHLKSLNRQNTEKQSILAQFHASDREKFAQIQWRNASKLRDNIPCRDSLNGLQAKECSTSLPS
jgi:hypothetical protein